MAVRPIDQDEVLYQLERLRLAAQLDDECEEETIKRCIAAVKLVPILTPPNEPLTLEQLREMKNEPAYLKVFDPLLDSGWHIIKAVTEDKIIFRGWETVYVPVDGMGIDYNLYRRPPEGEA